jgi:hypothetical protein
MKQITILILIALFALNVNAQYQPTQEQIVNMQKIKELQKTNKNGKNSKAIIKLMNQNIEIAKKTTKLTPTKK